MTLLPALFLTVAGFIALSQTYPVKAISVPHTATTPAGTRLAPGAGAPGPATLLPPASMFPLMVPDAGFLDTGGPGWNNASNGVGR